MARISDGNDTVTFNSRTSHIQNSTGPLRGDNIRANDRQLNRANQVPSSRSDVSRDQFWTPPAAPPRTDTRSSRRGSRRSTRD